MSRFSRTARAIAGAAALVLAVGLATALADVTVYSNDFSSRGEFRDIARSGGGKRCDRKYRQKSKALLASIKRSPTTCSFRTPVQGDDELPSYTVTVEGKILSKTPKSLRGATFLEIAVRAGGGDTGYKLRVFPQKKHYELLRSPKGGDFPSRGKDNAIRKGSRNTLRVVAKGAEITAFANGKELASVTDGNPGQVEGRKVRFALGSQKKSGKDVVGTFKRVAVGVPDPR